MSLNSIGIFLSVCPIPSCDDKAFWRITGKARFYERLAPGLIIPSTDKVKPEDDCPHTWFLTIWMAARSCEGAPEKNIGAILERKYSDYCDEDYIRMVTGRCQG